MATKCLIIAAGKGTRLQQKCDSKPLAPILGVPLIERVIRCALQAGADDFYVVIGYQGARVRAFLEDLAGRIRVPITIIANGVWEKENGLSVLKAREYLRDPFLLLMADHLFDPSIARELMEVPLDDGEIVLGIDGNTGSSLIDMEDVTRVRTESGKIVSIGKGLTDDDPSYGFNIHHGCNHYQRQESLVKNCADEYEKYSDIAAETESPAMTDAAAHDTVEFVCCITQHEGTDNRQTTSASGSGVHALRPPLAERAR